MNKILFYTIEMLILKIKYSCANKSKDFEKSNLIKFIYIKIRFFQ